MHINSLGLLRGGPSKFWLVGDGMSRMFQLVSYNRKINEQADKFLILKIQVAVSAGNAY